MRPTFNQTVDVLVKAYLNDTLQHGDCQACAVGNIISGFGYDFSKLEHFEGSSWLRYIDINIRHCGPAHYVGGYNEKLGLEQISYTGYSAKELSEIERVFEFNSDMFNGLMAVVDVLADIHGVDLTVKESAKLLFTK